MQLRLTTFRAALVLLAAGALAASALQARTTASAGVAAGPLSVRVPVVTDSMSSAAGSATNATAPCAPGSVLVGGGIRQFDTVTPNTETNGLKVNGTLPSDASGTPVVSGTNDASAWTAVGGFGGVGETDDAVSAFAVCASGGGVDVPSGPDTVVVTNAAVGDGGNAHPSLARVTATCPAGTVLVGGGALGVPPAIGNFKPIASFPSDASGVAVTDGAANPGSWTVLGGIMGTLDSVGVTTTAFAVCSYDTSLSTVARVTTLLNQAPPTGSGPGGSTPEMPPVTATCSPGTMLLNGGVQYLVGGGFPPQGDGYWGFHLVGDYPSDASGVPVPDGAGNPSSWTAIVHPGGITIPSIDEYAYALCGQSTADATADVAVTNADAPDPVVAGQQLAYMIGVANAGPDTAVATVVTDVLPAGTSFVSATSTAGSCSQASGTLTCSIGTLASGGAATVTLRVVAAAAGTISDMATATAATADPDSANNSAVASTTVVAASPTLSTQSSAGVVVGAAISDTATLASGASPTGEIAFRLYAPGDTTCAVPVFTATTPVAGNGAYTSAPFATSAAGTYRWVASYAGDASNNPAAGACGDAAESVAVTKAAPTLAAHASAAVPVGGSISDTATLAGGFGPTGSVTFSLYGPNPAGCSGAPVTTSSAAVTGNGPYTSASFTPTQAGNYVWVASYGGDARNESTAPTSCADAAQTVAVGLAAPALTTQASPGVVVGGSISDTATLSGGGSPTGSLTFGLHGPGDEGCTGAPVATSTVVVSGNGSYASPPFATALAGTYHWAVSYSGDANNGVVPPGCADADAVDVAAAAPSLVVQASGGIALGGSISATATLAGGFAPTGSIVFRLWAPGPVACAGTPAFTATVPVAGNGDYASGPFMPLQAGIYAWRAGYAGDADNAPVATGCAEGGATVTVTQATPTLTSHASNGTPVGGSIFDTATLAGGVSPTGTITFALYGSDAAGCMGTPVTSSTVTVNGNGPYVSPSFSPTQAGTYQWVASYGGDANNAAVAGSCADPAGTVVVPASADVSLTDTAAPSPITAGQELTYTLTIANAGPSPASNVVLVQTLPSSSTYGSTTASQGGCTEVGQPGGTVTCQLGTLAPGGRATVSVVAIPRAAGTIADGATVTSSVADPVAGNNSASASAQVNAPAGGGGSSGGGTSGGGAATPSGSTTTPAGAFTPPSGGAPHASKTATPGTSGSISLTAPGGGAMTVAWPASGLTGKPLTVTLAAIATTGLAPKGGFAAGTAVARVVVATGDGEPVTTFQGPLDIVFPDAPKNGVPAYSTNGKTWTAVPALAKAGELPAGWRDGWYRERDGTLHVLTLHATDFGLLTPKAKVTPALVVTFAGTRRIALGPSPAVSFTTRTTMPGTLTLTLWRGSRTVGTWTVTTTTKRTKLRLVPPRAAVQAGAYRLTLRAAAGKERATRVVALTFVAKGKK